MTMPRAFVWYEEDVASSDGAAPYASPHRATWPGRQWAPVVCVASLSTRAWRWSEHHHVKLPARLEGRSPGATQGELLVERALAHVHLVIIQQRRRRVLELSQEHHQYSTAWQDRDSASIQHGGKR